MARSKLGIWIGLATLIGMGWLFWHTVRSHIRYREIYARLPVGWIVNEVGVIRFPEGKPMYTYPEQFQRSCNAFAFPISFEKFKLYVDDGSGKIDVYEWLPKTGATKYLWGVSNSSLLRYGDITDKSGEVLVVPAPNGKGFRFILADGTSRQQKFQAVFFSNTSSCFWFVNGTLLGHYNVRTNRIERVAKLPFTIKDVKAERFAVSPTGSYIAFVSDTKKGFCRERTTISVYDVNNKKLSNYYINHFTVLWIHSINDEFLVAFSVLPILGRSWIIVLDLKSGDSIVWKEFPAMAFCPRFVVDRQR